MTSVRKGCIFIFAEAENRTIAESQRGLQEKEQLELKKRGLAVGAAFQEQ